MEDGRVIVRKCAACCDCVLMVRVAVSFGWGGSRSKKGVGKNWVVGISVVINGGAGNIIWGLKKRVVF